MKKLAILISLILLCGMATDIWAQQKNSGADAYQDKMQIIYAGLGLGYVGPGFGLRVPPILVGYEYFVHIAKYVPLSFGGKVGYALYGADNNLGFEYGYHQLMIDARAAYHFDDLIPNKKLMQSLDLYAGMELGLHVTGYSVEDPAFANYYDTEVYMDFGAFAGARWYFNNFIGVYGELGYGFSYLNVGAVFKL